MELLCVINSDMSSRETPLAPPQKTAYILHTLLPLRGSMENVVLIVHLLLALTLIGVVLLQRSEGGGLGMGSGGGSGGAMTGRGAASALAKVTWILAIGFIITSMTLTIIAAQKSAGTSVIDRLDGSRIVEQQDEQSLPDIDDLLPPTANDAAPLVPRAD